MSGDPTKPLSVRVSALRPNPVVAGLRSDTGRRTAGVPTLPQNAPFDSNTRLWIDGLLAGTLEPRVAAAGAVTAERRQRASGM